MLAKATGQGEIFMAFDSRHTVFRYGAASLAAAAIVLGTGGPLSAQASYGNTQTPEGWAWAQIKLGKKVDFNTRCRTPELDPSAQDETRWKDPCRRLPASFLVDVLTRSPWRQEMTTSGIDITGARIEGVIDLQYARLNWPLTLDRCQIEDDIDISSMRTDSAVKLVESHVAGNLYASELHIDASLNLSQSNFKRSIWLSWAKIGRFLSVDGVTLQEGFYADGMDVVGSLFLRSTETKSATFKDVTLRLAKVAGNIEATGATVDGHFNADALQLGGSLFLRSEGKNRTTLKEVTLTNAMVTRNVEATGATVDGHLNADGLQVGGSLFLRSDEKNKATFKDVTLRLAKVTGNVEAIGATVDGHLNADALQVAGAVLLRSDEKNKATFKDVTLGRARITGNVEAIGATVDGHFNADALHVGGSLFLRSDDKNKAMFKDVTLTVAKVTGNVEAIGATVEGHFSADAVQVGGSLFLRSDDANESMFNSLTLTVAKITGNVDATGATFDGQLNADGLEVGASIVMLDATARKRLSMPFVQTRGDFDIRGATLAELDLSGASINRDLRLGGGRTSTVWRTQEGKPGKLVLRNTHIVSLVDAKDAWPIGDHLEIEGFTFDQFGGYGGISGAEMRGRGMEWWDGWVRRDRAYAPSPYEQLAKAFVNAGDRAAADDIRFRGRVRQRATEAGWWPWTFAGFLQYVAGFGIGDYTFRVVYWVIGISLAGAAYLWTSVAPARANGPVWCLGASLSRLVPIIEINKEFSDFFNDPKRERLTGLQSFVFSAIGIVGWVLGAILVAAVSGLTQKP